MVDLSNESGWGRKLRPLVLVTMLAAGVAGNYLSYPVFLNIDFIFGSIFAMLVLQFFGLGWGCLAGAVAASYTYALWNHPYAIIIMTAEVAVAGWLVGRRKIGLVLADALFWLFIGMPLVYLFYHVVMHVPLSNAYITMTKQAVNGIANVLIARLLFTGYALATRSSRISYRDSVYNILAFFVLCPALTILAFSSRAEFSETDQLIRQQLLQDSRRLTNIGETWLQYRQAVVITLAEMAASRSPEQMQPLLEMAQKSDANFLRIGLLDAAATITAYYPLLDELGQPVIGRNFADRPFIPMLKQTLEPMFSDVVMGRVGVPKPMVTTLAPVAVRGKYAGYITGILSLERLRSFLEMSAGGAARHFTLLDKSGNVIMTNRDDQMAMQSFARGEGTLSPVEDGVGQWMPKMPTNVTISERWRRSTYVAESSTNSRAGWRLILEQPLAPVQKTLYDRYAGHLTRLFVILLGALALAEIISRHSTVTLGRLREATRNVPNRLKAGVGEFVWPQSRIQEMNLLAGNLREMGDALVEHYEEVRRINVTLEQRVEERTRQLKVESTRFRIMLDMATDGIHVLDQDGNLVLFSPSFARMLGYESEEMHGLSVKDWDVDCLSDELIPQVRSHVVHPKTFEIRHRRKDGSILDVEISSRGMELDDQIVIYNSARDITERKNLNRELIEARAAAEAASRAKSEFLANMSHEIRTPLNGVLGMLQLLRDDTVPEERMTFTNMAHDAGRRLLSLLNDILDFSRMEAGLLSLVPIRFSMAKLCDEVAAVFSLTCKDKGLALSFCVEPNVPAELVGDEARLRQILFNLVGNAIKFTMSGSVRVDAWAHPSKRFAGKTRLYISVSDTGVGIPDDKQVHVFERFTQSDASYTRQHEGAGLGLAIVKRIVELMNGNITMDSESGVGTTVYLDLLLDDISQLSIGGEEETRGGTSDQSDPRALKILLVDDEPIGLLSIQVMLTRMGHVVTTAHTGSEALSTVLHGDFDCILMDVQMPEMSGVEATHTIRNTPDFAEKSRIHIIALTAYAMTGDREKFIRAGMDDYVTKPVQMEELQNALMRVVEKRGKGVVH